MKQSTILFAIGQIFLLGFLSLQGLENLNGLRYFSQAGRVEWLTADSLPLQTASDLKEEVKTDEPDNYFLAVASWYGAAFDGRKMANGQVFNMYDETLVAHKKLPFGTKLEIVNPDNDSVLYATVSDRGPYISGRDFDLSYAGARKLDMVEKGVKKLKVRVIE